VLQCVAVCCSMLQCVAVCCSVLQCAVVAVWCSVLQCVAVCLQYTWSPLELQWSPTHLPYHILYSSQPSACTYDMTRSYVWHDPFTRGMTNSHVTPLIPYHIIHVSRPSVSIRDMMHWNAWHGSLIRVTWLIHDMTRWYAWHDSLICVTWPIHVCHMSHVPKHVLPSTLPSSRACVWMNHVTWLTHTWREWITSWLIHIHVTYEWVMSHMTHSQVWHDSLIRDVNEWRDSFTRDATHSHVMAHV